ncbi:MAG: LysR family transcriptional regulator [Eubacteriales bacterium]|nr:LysR family transcriptional regulator [Eubacteriales bacterium]
MNLLKAEIFLYAVDCGSLSRTAEVFGYTPSGISHMMSSFENEIGFPLLQRSKTGVIPTPNAKRIIPMLRTIIGHAEQFRQTVCEINGLACGSLRIAAYSSIASQWLPEVLGIYHKLYPQIRLNLFEGVWQEVEAYMQEHRADVGLYSFRKGITHNWIPLREDPMIVAVPLDHPLAKQAEVRLEELKGESIIMPAYGEDLDVLDLLQRSNIQIPFTFHTLENYSAMGMVEEGLGIMIANELITKGRTNRFKILPIYPEASITLGIAVSPESMQAPAVKHFIEICVKTLREDKFRRDKEAVFE